ncbi:MAG TPA: HAMP domain-containing protein, partial [Ktedonobacteraceae bacterium]|nr:HAMP domain-containing protein [Ktedonobacteraceae bacterium]
MLKIISTISISRRLLIAFMLAAVIPGIVISILGFAFTTEQKNRSRAIQTDIGALQTATTASSYLPRLRDLLKTLYQDHDENASSALKSQIPDVIAQLNTFSMLFDDEIRTYQQNYEVNTSAQMSKTRSILLNKDTSTDLPAQQQTVLGRVQNTSWPEYYVAQERVIGAITTDDNSSELATFVQYAQDKYSTLANDWDHLVHITESMNYTVAQIGPAETNPIILSTLVAFLSTIFVVTAIGYIVYLTITRPLHQLALLTRRIAQGETSARAVINGHDEIGLVAQSMNTMLDHIVHLIHDMQLQRDSLLARVEKLISEVSGIGEGDLRVQAEVTNDTLGILADSFNYMIEELSSLVVRVQKVSHEVSRSTMAALECMKQLVDTGQKQFQQIAEAELQINEMAIANHQIAERAQLFAGVARA